jgi:hypothetical protein
LETTRNFSIAPLLDNPFSLRVFDGNITNTP